MPSGTTAVKVAKITAIGVVLAALIGAGATMYATWNKPKEQPPIVVVTPNAEVKQVPQLNSETTASAVETLRDISMWDLRGWKQISVGQTNPRFSPVNYINYLHVKKLQSVDSYRAHYATSGSLIDLRCITHTAQVLTQEGAIDHPGEDKREYEVDVDVSKAPLNQEFLIVIEGTYWNSFQNATEEVSTYTDEDMHFMDELAIFVLMPESKPFRNVQRWARITGSTQKLEYRGEERFYEDKDGRFVYWSIGDRQRNHHYQLTWDW